MNKKILPLNLLLILIGILLFSVACGNVQTTPTIDPTQGVQLLAGEYLSILNQEDIKESGLINAGLRDNLGTWHFKLQEDGSLNVTLNGGYIAEGKYKVSGDEIEIYLDRVCSECDCAGNIGRYYWSLDGNELRIAKIVDSCDAMSLVITSKPLTQQP